MSGIGTSYIINHDTLVHNLFSNTTHDSHFFIFDLVESEQKSWYWAGLDKKLTR